jgi:nucleoid-associated protein YgaU
MMSSGRQQGIRRTVFLGVVASAALAAAALGGGCGSAPPAELPSPETGAFLTLEEQQQLSPAQLREYCHMLDDYLEQLRGEITLAGHLNDSLGAVVDSLDGVQTDLNREARVLERELRQQKAHRQGPIAYVTQPGDTLMKLSELFYGSAADWRKIYDANRELIEDPGAELPPGLKLSVPR